MKDLQAERERVAGLLEGATPAPWYWRAHKKANGTPDMPYLYSNTGTRDTVLDSAREGRYGSTLRFKVKRGAHGLMLTVPEMGESWASHPDAALIAQAPALARQLADALAEIERLRAALGEASTIVGQVERAQREPGVEGQRARWVFGPAAQVAEVIRAALTQTP